MLTFLLLTGVFIVAFISCLGAGRHKEVVANWEKYRRNPVYMFAAFMYKPDEDPRSRWQFSSDNFLSVMREYIITAMKAVLAPVMMIFQIMGAGLTQSIGGVGKIQKILDIMFLQFGKITDVFDNRFKAILHRLTMTFRKIQNIMSRAWGIAASSMYQSMAFIFSLLSTMDLIIKIVLIILAILVGIVIFLFLFLWPIIPVILTVIGIITAAGMGAAVGGMADTFCFTGNTPVVLADGTTQPIQSISIGTKVQGGTVLGVLKFQQSTDDLYELYGVRVSGSHIVYDPEPMHVASHPAAVRMPPQEIPLYCLITSHQRIPIMTTVGIKEFADWEEIDEVGQADWNRFVFETLNPGIVWDSTQAVLDGESVFHPSTSVMCPDGPRTISAIHPGMMVMNASGNPTRVVGCVRMSSDCAGSAWKYQNGLWKQVRIDMSDNTLEYMSLITESGTFVLEMGAVRDFTDVGLTRLPDTYELVLDLISQMKSSC